MGIGFVSLVTTGPGGEVKSRGPGREHRNSASWSDNFSREQANAGENG